MSWDKCMYSMYVCMSIFHTGNTNYNTAYTSTIKLYITGCKSQYPVLYRISYRQNCPQTFRDSADLNGRGTSVLPPSSYSASKKSWLGWCAPTSRRSAPLVFRVSRNASFQMFISSTITDCRLSL